MIPTAQALRRASASPRASATSSATPSTNDVGAEQEDEHRERPLRPDECEDAEHDRSDATDREHPPVAGHQTKHWNLLLSIEPCGIGTKRPIREDERASHDPANSAGRPASARSTRSVAPHRSPRQDTSPRAWPRATPLRARAHPGAPLHRGSRCDLSVPGDGLRGHSELAPTGRPGRRRRPRPTRTPISSRTASEPCRDPRAARPSGPGASRAEAPSRPGSGRTIGRSGTASRRP